MESGSWNESGDGDGGGGNQSPHVPAPDAIFFKKSKKKLDPAKFYALAQQDDCTEDSSPPSEAAFSEAERPRDVTAAAASGSNNPQEPIFFKKSTKKLEASRFFTNTENQPQESEGEVTSRQDLQEASNMEQSSQSLPVAPPAAPPPPPPPPPSPVGVPSHDNARERSSNIFSDGSQGNINAQSGSIDATGKSTVYKIIMADNARKLQDERKGKKRTILFDKGGAAATALAAVASILGSAVLAALLTPSEVIFTHKDQGLYQYNYCYVSTTEYMEDAVGSAYKNDFCTAMRALYSFTLVITLIFDILCLMSTIIVAIGMSTYLTVAYSFFILSIISQTLAIIAAVWLAFPLSAAIGGSVLLALFLIAAIFFVLPGIALAWHFKSGVNKTLKLEQPGVKRYASINRGFAHSAHQQQPPRVIEGTTVLHWAAYKGGYKHRLLLNVLLAAGEDVDVAAQGGGDGVTALMIAVLRGKTDVVKQLLGAGADVNRTETSNERSALHYAAQKGHTEIVKLLLRAGADTTAVDLLGHSPLNLARRVNQTEVATVIQDFVQDKLNFELLTAAKRRKGDRMRQLLAAGASPDSHDPRGTTALIWAANRGFFDGVSELLQKGAKVNAKNSHGSTALTEAALSGNAAVVRVLLDHKADPTVASDGSTALHRAARRGQAEVVEELLTRVPVDKQSVDEAALNKNHAALRSLLNKAREGKYGMSFFQTAAYIGSDPAVRLYLEKDALAVDEKYEVSALLLAAQEGHVDVVRTLVADGGADTERGDAAGKTPLHWAACEGYPCVVRELIRLKSKVDSVDCQGQTPLHAAAGAEKEHFWSSFEVAEALLAGGASYNVVDSNGKTPLDVAKEKGNLKLVECFEKIRICNETHRSASSHRLPV
jgi:ankyrin repeat protein